MHSVIINKTIYTKCPYCGKKVPKLAEETLCKDCYVLDEAIRKTPKIAFKILARIYAELEEEVG